MHARNGLLEDLVIVVVLVDLSVQLVNGFLFLSEFPLQIFFLKGEAATPAF